MMGYKQVIVVRVDLRMSRGKLAAQAAHAACEASERAREERPQYWRRWREEGAKKVVVSVESEEELLEVYEEAGRRGLPRALIRDAGLTELPPGTLTAAAVGPAPEEKVDEVTGGLRLLR